MSRLLETAEILKKLNELWDEHAAHINKAHSSLKDMIKTGSTIPSKYVSTLRSITEAQDAIIKNTQKLNSTTKSYTSTLQSLNSQRNATLAANKQLSNAVSELEKKLSRANKELAAMKANSSSAAAANSNQAAQIKKLTSEVDSLNNKLSNANNAINKIGTSSYTSYKMLSSLMAAFGIQIGLYLFADIVKNIYETTKELQSLDLALKMVTETEGKYAESKEYLSKVSEKWGLEIKSLTQQYIQFYTSSKGLLSDKAIQETFEGIAKAGSVMGLSLEKQSSAFYAIDQMMSKGTVSSEELKKQLGNAMPGAIKAAAMAYMQLHPQIKNIQEAEEALYAAMKKGAIDSATYVPLIVKNFEKLYGIEALNSVNTLVAEENRLRNHWTELIRSMNESETSGIQSFFKIVIKGLDSVVYHLIRVNDSWSSTFEKAFTRGKGFSEDFFKEYMSGFTNGQLTSEEKQNIKNRVTEIGNEIIKAQKDGLSLKVGMLQSERSSLLEQLFYADPSNKIAKLNEIKEQAKEQYSIYAREYNKIIGEASKKADKIMFTNIGDDNRSSFIARYMHDRKEDLKQFMGTEQGLIDLVNKELNPQKVAKSTNGGEDDNTKSRRERIKLNFDWIKSEYELKKAILETQRLDSSYKMNDESETLSKRIDARVEYSKKSMELLQLETDMEKAMNIEKYSKDLERNNVALRNKDISAEEHAKNILDLNKRLNNEQLKADQLYSQKWQALLHENNEFYKKINDKRLEYSKRTSKAEVDFYKHTLNEIINSKSSSDEMVLKSIQDLRKLEYDNAVKDRDEKLKLAGEEADLKKAIWSEFGLAVQDIDKRMNDAIEANRQRRIKRQMEISNIEREAYGHISVVGENIEGFLSGASENTKAKFEEILDNYKKAVATGDEEIIAERKRQLDEFINYVKSVNEYATSFFSEFVNNSGFQTLFDVLGGKIKDFGTDWKTTFLAISEITQETLAFLDKNSEAYFQAERDRLDERYDNEIELAGDNQAAKDDIDRQYEAKKREIAIRQAKHDKQMAMFKIGIDTAQAIMGLWINPGFPQAIPMAIAVTALGALQMASVASKPLPQFFKGTENSPEGFAWVDEQGPELHFDKDFNLKDFGSKSGPRIKYLSKGDKIIPAQKSKEILSNKFTAESFLNNLDELLFKNNIIYNNENKVNLDATEIISSIKDLKTSIDNKETHFEIFDQRGHRKYKIKNGQKIIDKSNVVRYIKNTF